MAACLPQKSSMTHTLVVLAHPDPASFNGAWAEASAEASRALGHQVEWSDLYAMGFDPVLSADAPLDEDVMHEIDKIRQADRIILHFPLWWFAPPAMLKGWFDRVLAHGELHSSQKRFDTGPCKGKQVLFCVTTGATEAESAPNGKEGDVFMHLWPAAYTLRYCGFTVLTPVTVHDVHHDPNDALRERMSTVLQNQRRVIETFDDRSQIAFNADNEFDAEGRLMPDQPSHSLFIRHPT